MEFKSKIKTKEEKINFRLSLKNLLDSLSKLYFLDEKLFLKTLKVAPYGVMKLIRDSEFIKNTGDIVDHLKELNFCYKSALRNSRKNDFIKEFTLRNFHDLQEFIMILNKLLYLNDLNHNEFLKIFPYCPKAYWDKIDDLRETSIKYKRDSLDFIECLKKCKKVSFLYSESINFYDENEEI
jgi:hypothetical protein